MAWESWWSSAIGENITTNALIAEAIGTFEGFANTDLSGVQVFEANLPSEYGVMFDRNTVLVNKAIVAGAGKFDSNSIRLLLNTLGHELTHVIQARTNVFFHLKYAINLLRGYLGNPFEIQAYQQGDKFEAYTLGR